MKLMRKRRNRKKSVSKKKKYIKSFRFGVDETPSWMNPFFNSNYAIPCSAKVFGPNNKKIHQKWIYISNQEGQLASKGDVINLTREGTLKVGPMVGQKYE